MRRAAWLLTTCVAFAGASPANATDSLEVQVNRAIERGVAVARTYLGPDGAGRTNYHGDYPEGDTALALYTLVKSGVIADDPQVKSAIAWLKARPMTKKTYSAAVLVLALDSLKDRAYDPLIHAAAQGLEEGLLNEPSNLWSYPGHHCDLSNAQYGALGLWTAERHGWKPRADTWATLLAGVEPLHKQDDGFAYRADAASTGAMTVAGVTVLELALARSPEGLLPARFAEIRRKAKAAHAKGWEYLDRRFSVEGNPHGAHSFYESWYYYYLYGIERLAAIAGRNEIGGRDWYAEGARKLVEVQREDGSWGGAADTCFALLFLRRATFTTMDRDLKPLTGEGVAGAAARPASPKADVPFVRRWLLVGPLDDPDDELLDKSLFAESRVSPVNLAFSGSNQWIAYRSLTDAVDLGGESGAKDNTLTCAFAWVHSAADTDVVLWFGHDNGARLWFDGKLVHERHFEEAYGPDSFAVRVRAEAGAHRLLMKVHNDGGGHALWMRIARPDGSRPAEIRTSLAPDDVEFEASAVANPDGVPLDDLLCLMPREKRARVGFDDRADVDRFAFTGRYGHYPYWAADPMKRPESKPDPGALGALAMHPESGNRPMTAYWKVKLPDQSPRVRLRVAPATTSAPGKADAELRIGVFDGREHWLASAPVGPFAAASLDNWRFVEADLTGFENREVLVMIQAANGGKTSWFWEGIWIDEIEIR